ncbi:MAG: hypothetical protein ABIO16_07420 [Nocardioides sp.]
MTAWSRMLVRWRRTEDGAWPFYAEVGGRVLRVRVNDFPAEPLYSLFVDDDLVEDLEDWPTVWIKTSDRPGATPAP